jgi:MFS family permease
MHVHGLSKTGAGNVLNMVAVGLIVGSPVLSMLSDRILASRKKVMVLSSIGVVATMLVLTLFTDRLAMPVLYIIFFCIGMFSAAIVVIAFTATKELFPVEIAGTSVGAVNLFPFAGGAAFQPLLGYVLELVGGETDSYSVAGYRAVFVVCLIASVIALLAISFMKETYVRESQAR